MISKRLYIINSIFLLILSLNILGNNKASFYHLIKLVIDDEVFSSEIQQDVERLNEYSVEENKIIDGLRVLDNNGFDSALIYFNEINVNDYVKGAYYLLKSYLHEKKFNIDSALYFSEIAEHIFTDTKDWNNYATVLISRCRLFSNTNQYNLIDSTIQELDNKGVLFTDYTQADILYYKGWSLLIKTRYEQAINLYLKALALHQKSNDIDKQIFIYNQLGIAYYSAEFPTKSLDNYREGLKLAKKNLRREDCAIILGNIARQFLFYEQYDSASMYYQASLSEAMYLKDQERISMSFYCLGMVHFKKKEGKLSENYLNNGIIYAEKSDGFFVLSKCYLLKSKISLDANSVEEAIKESKLALEYAIKCDRKRLIAISYLCLSKAYFLNNQQDESFIYKRLGDSVVDKYIRFNDYQLNEMKSYLELMDIKQKNLSLQKSVSFHYWVYYLIVIILFLCITLYSFLIRRKKEIGHEALKEELYPKDVIKDLIKTKDWTLFLDRFETLNPLFLQKVMEKHPQLSPNDLRIISLLRLNVTDKKIADILSIEYSSFRKAKSRLKKKLQIGDEISVTSYVLSL